MSRTSSYQKEKCNHPKCINGDVLANYEDESCWFGSEDDPKIFCSVQCKKHFLENFKEYKKLENLKQQVYTNNSRKRDKEERKREKLAVAICLMAEPKVSKNKIKEMIIFLGLESKNL